MAAAADDFVPDLQRRTIMNLVLLGGAGVPVLWLGGGFVYFFVPPGGGGGGGGLRAKDALGNDVKGADWSKKFPFPSRSLVQGLKGDAHYLIVKEAGATLAGAGALRYPRRHRHPFPVDGDRLPYRYQAVVEVMPSAVGCLRELLSASHAGAVDWPVSVARAFFEVKV